MGEEALPPGSQSVLGKLEETAQAELTGWTLAGGTGLALQIGHRLSEDFDFFRVDSVDLAPLHAILRGLGECKTQQNEARTLTVELNGCQLSFFVISDPFIFPAQTFRFFHLADIRDIALMKIVAISGRGSRKDFIDLYEILQSNVELKDCLAWFEKKYGPGRGSRYHILKSLCWFQDAEQEPLPQMLKPFDWDRCKQFFQEETAKFFE